MFRVSLNIKSFINYLPNQLLNIDLASLAFPSDKLSLEISIQCTLFLSQCRTCDIKGVLNDY